jgi:predicted Zn-dependent protease
MRTSVRWIHAALALGLAAGCQTVQTTKPGAVSVERQQTMMVSSQSMNKSAEKAYQQVLSEASRKGQLNRDRDSLERVRHITRRLIPRTVAFRPDAPRWAWETNVISDKQRNAWCMPGGKIVVYTGLVNSLRLTDDELAAVLGHEMAHALREHARERASQAVVQGVGLSVLGALTGSPGVADLSGLVLDLTLNLPNSREHETEADRVGIELAARAGYDPRAAVSVWEKMSRRSGGQPPEFLSTHPSHQHRIEDLRAYAEKVMPLYERSDDARGDSRDERRRDRERPARRERDRDRR